MHMKHKKGSDPKVRAFLHLAKEGGRLDADHTHADQHQGGDAKCAHDADRVPNVGVSVVSPNARRTAIA